MSKSKADRIDSIERMLTGGNPWVILMQTVDGPMPTLLAQPGLSKPFHTYRETTAKRVLADLRSDKRIVKAEIMRAKSALAYLLKAK